MLSKITVELLHDEFQHHQNTPAKCPNTALCESEAGWFVI